MARALALLEFVRNYSENLYVAVASASSWVRKNADVLKLKLPWLEILQSSHWPIKPLAELFLGNEYCILAHKMSQDVLRACFAQESLPANICAW